MIKKILSYGFVEGVAKGLNKLILLLLPFFLSNADYGKVGLIFALELLLPIISLLGFERAILRFYSVKTEFKHFNSTIYSSINVSHGLLLLLLCFIYFFGINEILGLEVFPDLFLIIVMVYCKGRNLFVLNSLRVLERHNSYFKARFVLQISQLIFVLGITWMTKSYFGYIIGVILSALLVNILFPPEERIKFSKFNKPTFNQLFVFSWPFIFHGVSANILGNADKFIIEKFMSMSHVGVYTLAYSYGSMMVFAFIGVSVYMEPLIYKQKSHSDRDKLLNTYLLMALLLAFITYMIVFFISKYLLVNIYGEEYLKSIELIPLVAIAYFIYPFYLKNSYTLIYNKQTKSIALVSFISAIISLGVNFVLIPKYGLYAPIYTLIVSYASQALGFSIISNKRIFSFECLLITSIGVTVFLIVYLRYNPIILVICATVLIAIYMVLNSKKQLLSR